MRKRPSAHFTLLRLPAEDFPVRRSCYAHNKFVVFCDETGAPTKIWTGSLNWDVTAEKEGDATT